MARTLQIAKKAAGIKISQASLNREKRLTGNPGYNERLKLVAASVTPERLKLILEQSTRGNLTWLHELYDKMDTDIQWSGLVDQVLRTLAGSNIKTVAARATNAKDQALADDYKAFIDVMHAQLNHRDIIKKMARGVMRGIRAFQVQYEVQRHGTKDLGIPVKIKTIAGQRYMWETEIQNPKYGELMIITSKNPTGAYIDEMDPGKVFAIDDGESKGRYDLIGIYRRAMSFWLLKLYATAWWGDKVEMFGEPFRIAHYAQGTPTKVKDEMEMFLAEMGRTAYALLPDGVNLKMVEAASSANGGVSVHGELIRYLDNKMAFTVLGQSDTSDKTSHGSRGRTGELMNISWELMEDYGAGVAEGYNALHCAAIRENYGSVVKHLVPRAELMVINPAVAKIKLDKFTAMMKAGIPVGVDTVYEEVGVNKPDKGAPVFVNVGFQKYDETPIEVSESDPAEGNGPVQSGQSSGSGKKPDSGNNKKPNA